MASIRGGAKAVEGLGRAIRRPGRGRWVAGFAVAVAGPILATTIGAIPKPRGTAIPALLYLLVVVAAAAIGHLWPSLVAAALSFVLLDYFFTQPLHTFRVSKGEDLLALSVFLLVAATVSASISAALEQRARAESREHQVRALYNLTTRLLSGTGLEEVLKDLAGSLRRLYGLAGCRIVVLDREGREAEGAVSGSMDEPVTSVPLAADGRTVGRIEMSGGSSGGIGGPEGEVLSTFAGQLALALERARLGTEASEARVEAQASRIRAALFSSVTHDLRTPLASITASASSLLEEGVPFSNDQRRDLLRTILEESQRLNRLVANLLDLSRIRSGALVPHVEAVPLEDLVSSVAGRLRGMFAGRGLQVVIRDDVPPVMMDVVQMDQVLTNLLENAARYSPPGAPVKISAVRWQRMVEVKVVDRGPGIPLEERSRVFEEFYRKDVQGRRGGTGLGLAIAHAIVAAHGGSMWIEDTPGGGTTIGFRLPIGRADVAPDPGEARVPS
jgi:two-component system, OmpR family, sensor histidine kinase KdpD